LAKILASPQLETSPSLCRFLKFVVEETLAGRGGLLKEYSLGAEVFTRGDAFDPRMDPIVRVQARNLRARLAQYYSGPGADDPILIELPKRTYVPVFHFRTAEAPPGEQSGEPPREVVAETGVTPASSAAAVAVSDSVPAATPSSPASTAAAPRQARPGRRLAQGTAAIVLLALSGAVFWQARPHDLPRRTTHVPDPVAQDLYTRGRFVMDHQTEQSLRESIDLFQQAVDKDPGFAAAYAGMADSYNVLAQYGYIAPSEGMQQARQAANRALAIDPHLAEAHVSLAAVMEAYDWDWGGAEREYKKALELNPWLSWAHLWYGMFLRDQGRLPEALPELRRAAQLEPYSVMTNINLAHAFMLQGDFASAEQAALHAAQAAPEFVTAHVMLSNAYRMQARNADSDAALARAVERSDDNPHALSLLTSALARRGRADEARRLKAKLDELSRKRYVSPYDSGLASLVLGEEDQALAMFQEAYRQRSSGLIFLRDAKFDSSEKAAQFHSLIQKMHFAG
jgi:tetratricopeptide (TPR) repeat protein